jgi:site-specific recombinase XerD
VSPGDAEEVMNQIAAKTNNSMAHETYKRIKSCFSAIFTHAMRKGLIHQNPVSALHPERETIWARVLRIFAARNLRASETVRG